MKKKHSGCLFCYCVFFLSRPFSFASFFLLRLFYYIFFLWIFSILFLVTSALFPVLPWNFRSTSALIPCYFRYFHGTSYLVSLSYTMPAFSANSFALFGLELYEGIG